VKNAEAIAASVTGDGVRADMQAAIAWLDAQPFVRSGKIAACGFGYGADLAFVAAGVPELRGAIAFYPMHVSAQIPGVQQTVLDLAANAHVPLLVLFGDQDYYVPRYDIDQLAQALRPLGRDACVEIYPNVGHSFFRHGRPQAIMELQRYSDEAVAQAVADAWNMVRKFLDDVFNRPPRHAAETGDIRTERTQSARA
jgi:carboxymethylenebutenolidase